MSGRGGSTRTIEQHGQPTPVCQACQRWLWRQRISHGGQCSSRDPPALTSFALADLSTRARLGARRPIGPPPPPTSPTHGGAGRRRATFAAGLIPLLATVNVLLSATRRDRLDGNTFKALNVGLAVWGPCPVRAHCCAKAQRRREIPYSAFGSSWGFLTAPPQKTSCFSCWVPKTWPKTLMFVGRP